MAAERLILRTCTLVPRPHLKAQGSLGTCLSGSAPFFPAFPTSLRGTCLHGFPPSGPRRVRAHLTHCTPSCRCHAWSFHQHRGRGPRASRQRLRIPPPAHKASSASLSPGPRLRDSCPCSPTDRTGRKTGSQSPAGSTGQGRRGQLLTEPLSHLSLSRSRGIGVRILTCRDTCPAQESTRPAGRAACRGVEAVLVAW